MAESLWGCDWFGTEYAPDSNGAWFFSADRGCQASGCTGFQASATAVRTGDAPAVPEPLGCAPPMVGLTTLALARRRLKVGDDPGGRSVRTMSDAPERGRPRGILAP